MKHQPRIPINFVFRLMAALKAFIAISRKFTVRITAYLALRGGMSNVNTFLQLVIITNKS